MKRDEMEMLRAVSVELDEDTVFILSYQYHTEIDPADPEGKRKDRSKSRYRMIGRVEKKTDLQAKMTGLMTDANRLGPWKWPDDPTWNGAILYSKDAGNAARANWIRLKLKKAVSWNDYVRIVDGFKKDVDRKSKTFGQYVVPNPGAVYEKDGYSCSDGSTVSIVDREALRAKTGMNIWKEIVMKTAKKNMDEAARANPGEAPAV